jgi:hypothetical protein
VHETKKWCRLHPDEIPLGMSTTLSGGDNSHTLCRRSERIGSSVETLMEVRMQLASEAGRAAELPGQRAADSDVAVEPGDDSESMEHVESSPRLSVI